METVGGVRNSDILRSGLAAAVLAAFATVVAWPGSLAHLAESLPLAGSGTANPQDLLVFILSLFASVFYIPWSVERATARRARVTQRLIVLNVLIFGLTVLVANAHLAGDRIEGQRLVAQWQAAYGPDYETVALRRTRDAASYRRLWLMEHADAEYVFEPHYSTLNAFAYRPAEPSLARKLIGVIGSMFLHGSPLHLFGNMLFLWVFGRALEDELGSARYLLAYLVAGICGTVMYHFITIWWMPDSAGLPAMGASGAIAGLLGAFALRLRQVRVHVFCIPPMSWPIVGFAGAVATGAAYIVLGPVAARIASLATIGGLFWCGAGLLWVIYDMAAIWAIGAWLVLYNIVPGVFSALTGHASGVAHWAHIGGFAGGLLCVLCCRGEDQAASRETLLAQPLTGSCDAVPHDAAAQHASAALGIIHRHLRSGHTVEAAGAFKAARQHHVDLILTPDQQFRLGQVFISQREWQCAADTLAEIFFAHPASLLAEDSLLLSARLHLDYLHQPQRAADLLHIFQQYYPTAVASPQTQHMMQIARKAQTNQPAS